MNVHRNAKLTPGGRALLVERLLAGELQARHIFTRPYGHSNERRVQLRPFLNYYNRVRPHWGIARKTPQQRLVELRVTDVLGSNI